MWKLLCKTSCLLFLVACQQEMEITPADDLNRFYKGSGQQIFAVKTGWFQAAKCADLENWAKKNLPDLPNIEDRYIFVANDKDITAKGNPYLKSEYDIMVFEYMICKMDGQAKQCYICRDEN